MRLARCWQADKEIKAICKKHRGLASDIDAFERLLANEYEVPGTPYAGLRCVRGGEPAAIIKSQVATPSMKRGKQSGVRYVYEKLLFEGELWAWCLGVYLHGQGVDSEADRRASYQERFGQFDVEVDLEYHEILP